MGLDVHLKRCEDKSVADALRKTYDERLTVVWDEVLNGRDFNILSDEEREEIRSRWDVIKKELGFGDSGENPLDIHIELDHPKYPDNYNKIGYFYSSYNSSGINMVLDRIGIRGLYWIFEHAQGEYNFTPDWNVSLARVNEVINSYHAIKTGKYNRFDYGCATGYPNQNASMSIESAMDTFRQIYLDKIESEKKFPDVVYRSYTTIDGTFFLNGKTIYMGMIGKSIYHDDKYTFYYVDDSAETDKDNSPLSEEDLSGLSVMSIAVNENISLPKSEFEASLIFKKLYDASENNIDFKFSDEFSFMSKTDIENCSEPCLCFGLFDLGGIDVYAVMRGKIGRIPCVYIIYKDTVKTETIIEPISLEDDCYAQTLEIVRDTILYVLSLPEEERKFYYLCWSS